VFDNTMVRSLLTAALLASAVAAQADTIPNVFNMPAGDTSLQFISVGDPGNAADSTTGLGAVGYTYQRGKYDVTLGQYCQFLNAVAKTDIRAVPNGETQISSRGVASCDFIDCARRVSGA
jgi:hypothetical protein